MRSCLLGLLFLPTLALADPDCEKIYWGEVFDGALGTDYGLLPLDGTASDGSFVAARGADREDPDAVQSCPSDYDILQHPKLMLSQGGALSDTPDDWGKNSDYQDALVVHDPDGVGTASVTVFWDAGDALIPIRTALLGKVAETGPTFPIMAFGDIAALFPDGDGILLVHDLKGPVLTTHYMRWSSH